MRDRKITSRDIAKLLNVEEEFNSLLLESDIKKAYDVVMGDVLETPNNTNSNETKCQKYNGI